MAAVVSEIIQGERYAGPKQRAAELAVVEQLTDVDHMTSVEPQDITVAEHARSARARNILEKMEHARNLRQEATASFDQAVAEIRERIARVAADNEARGYGPKADYERSWPTFDLEGQYEDQGTERPAWLSKGSDLLEVAASVADEVKEDATEVSLVEDSPEATERTEEPAAIAASRSVFAEENIIPIDNPFTDDISESGPEDTESADGIADVVALPFISGEDDFTDQEPLSTAREDGESAQDWYDRNKAARIAARRRAANTPPIHHPGAFHAKRRRRTPVQLTQDSLARHRRNKATRTAHREQGIDTSTVRGKKVLAAAASIAALAGVAVFAQRTRMDMSDVTAVIDSTRGWFRTSLASIGNVFDGIEMPGSGSDLREIGYIPADAAVVETPPTQDYVAPMVAEAAVQPVETTAGPIVTDNDTYGLRDRLLSIHG